MRRVPWTRQPEPANSAESNRSAFCADDATRNTEITQAVIADSTGRIYGSYIHGLFDMGEIAGRMIQTLAREKGISLENGVWEDYRIIKERQYDKLADTCGNICVWRKSMECSEKPIFHNYTGQGIGADPDHAAGRSGEKTCEKALGHSGKAAGRHGQL